jgi:hypothetical protein
LLTLHSPEETLSVMRVDFKQSAGCDL